MSEQNEVNEVKCLRLEQPIVVRKVPMTTEGCNMLRAVREYQIGEYEKRGIGVEIPFPVSIHLALKEFCAIKSINY